MKKQLLYQGIKSRVGLITALGWCQDAFSREPYIDLFIEDNALNANLMYMTCSNPLKMFFSRYNRSLLIDVDSLKDCSCWLCSHRCWTSFTKSHDWPDMLRCQVLFSVSQPSSWSWAFSKCWQILFIRWDAECFLWWKHVCEDEDTDSIFNPV